MVATRASSRKHTDAVEPPAPATNMLKAPPKRARAAAKPKALANPKPTSEPKKKAAPKKTPDANRAGAKSAPAQEVPTLPAKRAIATTKSIIEKNPPAVPAKRAAANRQPVLKTDAPVPPPKRTTRATAKAIVPVEAPVSPIKKPAKRPAPRDTQIRQAPRKKAKATNVSEYVQETPFKEYPNYPSTPAVNPFGQYPNYPSTPAVNPMAEYPNYPSTPAVNPMAEYPNYPSTPAVNPMAENPNYPSTPAVNPMAEYPNYPSTPAPNSPAIDTQPSPTLLEDLAPVAEPDIMELTHANEAFPDSSLLGSSMKSAQLPVSDIGSSMQSRSSEKAGASSFLLGSSMKSAIVPASDKVSRVRSAEQTPEESACVVSTSLHGSSMRSATDVASNIGFAMHTTECSTDDEPLSPSVLVSRRSALLPPSDIGLSMKSAMRSPEKAEGSPKKSVKFTPHVHSQAWNEDSFFVPDGPLSGLLCHVDINSNGKEQNHLFVGLLEDLGARVVAHWDGETNMGITHVIFKEGSAATLQKVEGTNGMVKCVNVGWAIECEKQNKRVAEAEYAIDLKNAVLNTPMPNRTRRGAYTPYHTPGKRKLGIFFQDNGEDSSSYECAHSTVSPPPTPTSSEWDKSLSALEEEKENTPKAVLASCPAKLKHSSSLFKHSPIKKLAFAPATAMKRQPEKFHGITMAPALKKPRFI